VVLVTKSSKSIELAPIRKRMSLADEIVDVLMGRISSGDLKAGDQLPTEQQLADAFQVSRAVVREAIARLRQQDLVYSQQGKGVFVSDAPEPSIANSFEDTLTLPQVMQFRLALEPAAAQLAAVHRTDIIIDKLRRAVERIGKAAAHSEEGAAADFDFHMAIACGSGNPLFVSALESLNARLANLLGKAHVNTRRVSGSVEAVHREHAEILEAILRGDQSVARSAMERHLTRAAARLSINLPQF